jgi:hypothetical protein
LNNPESRLSVEAREPHRLIRTSCRNVGGLAVRWNPHGLTCLSGEPVSVGSRLTVGWDPRSRCIGRGVSWVPREPWLLVSVSAR